jgi:hypothetical protein
MEFFTYIFIYFCALYFIIFPDVFRERTFIIFWFSISMLLSVLIRIKTDPTHGSDILSYINLMKLDEIPILYYREFIFFFGMKYLYDLIGNPIIVLVVFDFIFLVFLFRSISLIRKSFFIKVNSHNSYYIYFGILLFFPIVLGMHNAGRSLLSTIIIMNAFYYIVNRKYLKGYIIFLISFFIHNSAIYFLPILIFTMKKPLAKTLSVIILFLIVFINISLPTATNEFLIRDLTTNIEFWKLTFSYIFFLLIILLLLGVFEVFNSRVRETYFFWTSLMLIIIYFSSVSAFTSGVSQRVAFIVFSYLFPVLALYIDLIFKEKKIMRFIFLNASIIPLPILWSSTIPLPSFL